MASSTLKSSQSHPWVLPHFRQTLRYPWSTGCEGLPPRHILYDVKFYPYHTSATTAPVFVLVGNREIVICHPSTIKGEGLTCVNVFRDLEPVPEDWSIHLSSILNSCAWNYVEQSVPLVSVAGPSGLIKVLNALTGELVTTLIGHGGEVNDLATHPLYPWILASASGDHSIRIWDLRRKIELGENACLIICGHGHGHKEPVLTCAWHSSGRYLISGGQDHMVCIWAVPDLAPKSVFFDVCEDPAKAPRSSAETSVIHYPHFATSAVHSNYVDCVGFYGDLVLSKAADENKIVLWMITGFDSKACPPSPDSAPGAGTFRDTRSGFLLERTCSEGSNWKGSQEPSQSSEIPLFTRLLEFQVPYSELFYMRFSLLMPSRAHPHLHPVLAIGNTKAKVFFWDLMGLEVGHDAGTTSLNDEDKFKRPGSKGKKRAGEPPFNRRAFEGYSASIPRSESPLASSSRRSSSVVTTTNASSPALFPQQEPDVSTTGTSPALVATPPVAPRVLPRISKYRISDPFTSVPAHYSSTPNVNYHLSARQAAWSPCGRWCVVAGESGSTDAMAVIYDRWV
jgi:polycomb protein EED